MPAPAVMPYTHDEMMHYAKGTNKTIAYDIIVSSCVDGSLDSDSFTYGLPSVYRTVAGYNLRNIAMNLLRWRPSATESTDSTLGGYLDLRGTNPRARHR